MDLRREIENWDMILKNNGFRDIEDRRTGFLDGWKRWDVGAKVALRDDQVASEGRFTYYTALSHYASNVRKLDATTRAILQLAGEGLSHQKIADALKVSKSRVFRTLEQYINKALRYYYQEDCITKD